MTYVTSQTTVTDRSRRSTGTVRGQLRDSGSCRRRRGIGAQIRLEPRAVRGGSQTAAPKCPLTPGNSKNGCRAAWNPAGRVEALPETLPSVIRKSHFLAKVWLVLRGLERGGLTATTKTRQRSSSHDVVLGILQGLALFSLSALGCTPERRVDARLDPYLAYPAPVAAQIVRLGSHTQTTRDSAATFLRKSYVSPDGSRWAALCQSLRIGDSRALVEERLRKVPWASGGGFYANASMRRRYRLDGEWLLACDYDVREAVAGSRDRQPLSARQLLRARSLVREIEGAIVNAPEGMNGVWTTYYFNGQRRLEERYEDGRRAAISLFRSNGSLLQAQIFNTYGSVVQELDFYESGSLMTVGVNPKNARGAWLSFNEDGTLQSIGVSQIESPASK